MTKTEIKAAPGRLEFILLMAAMSAIDAFSIDSMLPALDQIGRDLDVAEANNRQFIVTVLFLGFATGVLVYGFVADRFGRRLPVIGGFLVYLLGTLICIFSMSFEMLLAGRVLQGMGAAGPYVLAIAIVRDRFQGSEMARILSLIMMVFIGVPMIAPFVGQGVLMLAGWRSIFIVLASFALVTLFWFAIRQAETLPIENRQRLSLAVIFANAAEVLRHPQSLRYLLALGLVSGAFIAYLSTAQQIFQGFYQLGSKFPLIFASLASLFGIGSFINSRLVSRLGEQRLVRYALLVLFLASVMLLWFHRVDGQPTLVVYIMYVGVMMLCFAMLFGNMTSLAMEPMGHIAGAASSLINSFSAILAVLVATIIGSQLGDTVIPVVAGFAIVSVLACLLNGKLKPAGS